MTFQLAKYVAPVISVVRSSRIISHRVMSAGFCPLYIVVLASFACNADEKTSSKLDGIAARQRTWAEVKVEIDKAFDACHESVKTVTRKQPPGVSCIGGTSGFSIRPETSVMEIVFDRRPCDRLKEATVIIDIRIERDYDGNSGKASPFRIIRHIAKDEGHDMIAEMVSFFKSRKWPYEILDRKKNPNEKKEKQESEKKLSPVF